MTPVMYPANLYQDIAKESFAKNIGIPKGDELSKIPLPCGIP